MNESNLLTNILYLCSILKTRCHILCLPESGLPLPESGLPLPESGLPLPESGLPLPESGLPQPESGLPLPESGLPLLGVSDPGAEIWSLWNNCIQEYCGNSGSMECVGKRTMWK